MSLPQRPQRLLWGSEDLLSLLQRRLPTSTVRLGRTEVILLTSDEPDEVRRRDRDRQRPLDAGFDESTRRSDGRFELLEPGGQDADVLIHELHKLVAPPGLASAVVFVLVTFETYPGLAHVAEVNTGTWGGVEHLPGAGGGCGEAGAEVDGRSGDGHDNILPVRAVYTMLVRLLGGLRGVQAFRVRHAARSGIGRATRGDG